MLALQGAQVQSLVKELRSYESLSVATHTKETAKKHHEFSATLQDFTEINFTAQTPVLMSQRCICVSLLRLLKTNNEIDKPAAAAAAAAKSPQSCPTLCDPRDGSPPVPVILQARTLEWVAISFSNALK